jgi:DNA polymerase
VGKSPESDRRRDDLAERLKFFEEIGADFLFPKSPESPAPPPLTVPVAPANLRPASSPRALIEIHAEILVCPKCALCRSRTHAVPGEGNPEAELMFVGEGPGQDEDLQGRPFVGRAGQLLTRIIAAMGFERSDVFITNIVKCRPPQNRVPRPEEIEACAPYLLEQAAEIRPKVIVALGKTSADYFRPDSRGMTERRGQFFDWRGIPVMVTFHPSYLVRNEGNKDLKRMVWDDMKQVLAKLGRA